MAGNRARYDEALQRGNERIWAEKWAEAAEAYRRALQEFPNQVPALVGYAWALFNLGQLDEAAPVYQRLTQVAPTDPGPYERLADIRERQGRREEAGKLYSQAAECYKAQGQQDKQAAALECAVQVYPQDTRAWEMLFNYYPGQGQVAEAITAALWLAHLYQEENPDRAIDICRQAQSFAPHDRRLGQAMTLLQSGRPVPQPKNTSDFLAATAASPDAAPDGAADEPSSPMEVARQRALEALAESVFAEERPQPRGISQQDVSLLITRAVDAQTRGDLAEAVSAYEQLIAADVSMPSIHFNLGLYYKEQMRFEDAIMQLERSVQDPEFMLGSHFALGECYQAKGAFNEALGHFLEAVKVIDLATVEREQVDDLFRVYEGLAQSLVNAGESERVESVLQSLVGFLGQRGWEEEVVRARRRLDALARDGTVLSLAEVISLPGAEEIMRSVALSQEYMRRQKSHNALEELAYTVAKAPFYLPLHSMLANFLMTNGNLDAALEKYRMIARTYETRGQTPQSLATYSQILEISPLDIAVHVRVIDLLIQHGQIDKALEQHLQLADAYYQLAQPERAREAYADALRLVARGSDERQWKVRILHRMADLDMQRLDWMAAIKDYEEITRGAPDDERAHLGLMRLYPRTGRMQLGVAALDRLIKRYLQTKRVEKAMAVLEDLVQEEPDSIPLRYRLIQICISTKQRERALEHLDVLGDLQLDAGQEAEALKTIETIISLKPDNLADYEQLYRDLAARARNAA